jgi:hypothetical protein
MADDLEACPFCGGDAAFLRLDDAEAKDFGGEVVQCLACHASTALRFPCMEDVKPLLAEAWNRRAPLTRADNPPGEGVVLRKDVVEAVISRLATMDHRSIGDAALSGLLREALTAPRPAAPGDGEAMREACAKLCADKGAALLAQADDEMDEIASDQYRWQGITANGLANSIRALAPPVQAPGQRIHQAPPFETLKGLRFSAKDSDGQCYYVNHAGTWQGCPPLDEAAPGDWEAMREACRKAVWDAIDPSTEGVARICAEKADAAIRALAPSAARDEQTGGVE